MKRCPRCNTVKPLSQFYTDPTKTAGVMSHCRDCCNDARRNRYNANLGHERRRSRTYYANNREAVRMRQNSLLQQQRYREWKARNPDGLWEQWLKKAHGMLPEQWFAMWEQQEGVCYLCEQGLPDDRSKVVVDHDHSHCGKKRSCRYCRRGLAHDYCNLLLGMLGEDTALMRRTLATFITNFERTQAQTQALMASAPEQGELPLRLVSGE